MPSHNSSQVVEFGGFKFSRLGVENSSSFLKGFKIENGNAFHLVNAFSLYEASKSKKLTEIFHNGTLLCDGRPLSLVLRITDRRFRQIRGVDLMKNIVGDLNSLETHFFLGSTPKVLKSLLNEISIINPKIQIVGSFSPPFAKDFQSSIFDWVHRIRESGATCVWVGLGTPKQDFVANEIANAIPVKVFAVGAAFDFLAGTRSEAPKIFKKLYLEWLYRFLNEPKRLFKRYLIGNSFFIMLVFKHLFILLRKGLFRSN